MKVKHSYKQIYVIALVGLFIGGQDVILAFLGNNLYGEVVSVPLPCKDGKPVQPKVMNTKDYIKVRYELNGEYLYIRGLPGVRNSYSYCDFKVGSKILLTNYKSMTVWGDARVEAWSWAKIFFPFLAFYTWLSLYMQRKKWKSESVN